MTRLIAMTDADFAWLQGEATRDDLTLAPGGIMPAEVTAMLRDVTAGVAAKVDHPVAWLIADGDEVVGMISLTRRGADGRFELGYGVAPSREGRGHATRAVALLAEESRRRGYGLTAETSTANPASARVVQRNGFVRTASRDDPEDGPLDCWALEHT